VKNYYVYIMASRRNGTIYIGVTNDIERRVAEHKQGLIEGFTKDYRVHLLVYLEWFSDIRNAIQCEKQMKKWNRQWKLNLIEKENPEWIDLSTVGYNTRNLDSQPKLNANTVIPAKAGIQVLSSDDSSSGLDSTHDGSCGIRGNDNTAGREALRAATSVIPAKAAIQVQNG
jgi:putative endonuclease